MKRVLTTLLLIPIVLFSTGCPNYKPKTPAVLANNVIKYEVNKFADDLDEYYSAIDDTTPANIPQATIYRDRVIEHLKRAIDGDYHDFENQLFTRRATTNSILDMVEYGAHAASIVTHGEQAKTVISTLLTAFRGGRKSIDENFFKEQTTGIIISQMQSSRARIEANIRKSMQGDASKYSLDAALGDLVNYFYAGTLQTAVTELAQQTGQNAINEKINAATESDKLRAGIQGAATIEQIEVATANISKLEGLAERFEAATKDISDADKDLANPAVADKTPATNKKIAATEAQTLAIDQMKKVYQLVESDALLKPLLNKIVDKYGNDSPDLKKRIQDSLKRLNDKDPNHPATGEDYELILQLLGGVVVANLPTQPALRDHWKSVLATIP